MSATQTNKTRAPLHRRLLAPTGETMVETLVSVLVSALALLMLATVVGTAVSIVTSSKQSMSEHYTNETAMARQTSGSGTSAQMDVSVPLDEGGSTQIDVTVYVSGDGSAIYECEEASHGTP